MRLTRLAEGAQGYRRVHDDQYPYSTGVNTRYIRAGITGDLIDFKTLAPAFVL